MTVRDRTVAPGTPVLEPPPAAPAAPPPPAAVADDGARPSWRGRAAALAADLWRSHRHLIVLLAVAWTARLALAVSGGQLFFPDEARYPRSLELLALLRGADVSGALELLARKSDHTGFVIVGLLPALVHQAASSASGVPPERLLLIPGVLFTVSSVVVIALVHAVARRVGAGRREALLAAYLMACSGSMFFWARHLLPYDTAMAFALGALWLSLRPERSTRVALGTGLLAGLAFLTYNGYWTLCLFVLAASTLYGTRGWRQALTRGAATAAGFFGLWGLLVGATKLAGTPPLLKGMRYFATTVTQGYAPEGFTFPWAFLWHAEHGLLLAWIAGTALLAHQLLRRPPGALPLRHGTVQARGLLWLSILVPMYLLLAVDSAVLRLFFLYGRLVRQLVPFFCLATAAGVVWWVGRRGWQRPAAVVAVPTALALLALQAAYNFATPLAQQFPHEVARQVEGYGEFARDVTVTGPPVSDSGAVGSRLVLLNAQYLYPPRGPKAAPAGTVLARFPHPLQFRPFQYEGFSPVERAILRREDVSMRLVETTAPSPAAAGLADSRARP